MTKHRRIWPASGRILPILLAGAGVYLLVGCIWLPIPEHKVNQTQKDFRDMVAADGSSSRFHRAVTTRSQVNALLGAPAVVSSDGRRVAYFVDTEEGLWIWPLCFQANVAARRQYFLILEFDQNDALTRYSTSVYKIGPDISGYINDFPLLRKDLEFSYPDLLPRRSPTTQPE